MNQKFTIIINDDVMKMTEGKEEKSRLVWQGCGAEFWIVGKLAGMNYERAGNLAMQKCIDMHIPLISLRLVSTRNGMK